MHRNRSIRARIGRVRGNRFLQRFGRRGVRRGLRLFKRRMRPHRRRR